MISLILNFVILLCVKILWRTSHGGNLNSSSIQMCLRVCPQVYAVGGYDGQSRLSSVECYDSFSNRWTEVAPMKEAVSSPAVASCAVMIFVIGGGPDDDTCSDKVGNRCVLPP